jgi:hypothetical protein
LLSWSRLSRHQYLAFTKYHESWNKRKTNYHETLLKCNGNYIFALNMTTEQALNEIFNERAWWKDSGINESSARSYKKRFLEGRLEIETQIRILNTLGFKLVQQMQWEKS